MREEGSKGGQSLVCTPCVRTRCNAYLLWVVPFRWDAVEPVSLWAAGGIVGPRVPSGDAGVVRG